MSGAVSFAKVMVAPHGAGLTNMLHLPEGIHEQKATEWYVLISHTVYFVIRCVCGGIPYFARVWYSLYTVYISICLSVNVYLFVVHA